MSHNNAALDLTDINIFFFIPIVQNVKNDLQLKSQQD